jgi:exosortase/archaeosortase family protein
MRKFIAPIIVLTTPIASVAVVHHFFHEVLGPNNLALGIYSRDVYVPLVLGLVFAIYKLVEDGLRVRFQLIPAVASVGLVWGIVSILKNIDGLSSRVSIIMLATLLFVGCVALVVSSFLVTINFRELLEKIRSRGRSSVYLLLALIALFEYPIILQLFWSQASHLTAVCVYHCLKIFGILVIPRFAGWSFNLWNPNLSIEIVMGCSGLEGMFFFVFAFSLVQYLKKRSFTWSVAVPYALGAMFLFVLNVARITAFFMIALAIGRSQFGISSKVFLEQSFHLNLGWILYLIGICLFLYLYHKLERQELPGEDF